MKRFKADIIVRLKNGIKDPQGQAIETVLKRTKLFDASVQAGKFFSITLEAENLLNVKEQIKIISDEVLSNPILEEYEVLRVDEL